MPTSVSLIDVASPRFWLCVLLGVLVLTPVTHPRLRCALWAGVNLVFLLLYLQLDLVYVVSALALLRILLHAVTVRSLRRIAVTVVLVAAIGLFVFHKLHGLASGGGSVHLSSVLTTIAFSYVFLRVLDVLRAVWEQRAPAPTLTDLINYLLPFHMLPAGPIQSYEAFVAEPAGPAAPTFERALRAAERIAAGLFKKYVLAYLVLQLASTRWTAGGWYRVFEMNAHFVWLYLDFSAYSDIAVGIGILLAVATPENFNRPYLARNITEFWERWHISLSDFIRRHLFVPLQLGMLRRWPGTSPLLSGSLAIAISFTLCGAWHGLSAAFLAWGVFHAAALIACNLYGEVLKRWLGRQRLRRYLASAWIRAVSVVITFEAVAFSVMLIGYQWAR